MNIRTNIDEYKSLIYEVHNKIDQEPLSNFEKPYNKLIQVLLSNIPENKDDLLLLFSKGIDECNEKMSVPLSSATEREKAFYNAGRFRGICDLIAGLGEYDKSLEKFLKPYIELEIGDIVYIKNNNILYKTTVAKKSKDKIQVKYGNKWFSSDDYLDYIFPYDEKENLCENDLLRECNNCERCAGFKQGKCAYGYSLSTYYGFTYRFDNTKYKVIKGRPKEPCSKTVKN